MKLKLPEVTLVMVETREHTLARMAIEECVSKIEFGDVLILTDRPLEFAPLTSQCDYRIHVVEDWPEKKGWSQAWWYDVPPLIRTAFTLNIQWDSWVWDTTMWDDNFLNYDYIGAPWWHKDWKNVGNGGFSLVSTPLKRYMREKAWDFPCDTPVDDALLCRTYRHQLEGLGFKWAPEKLAHKFAFECCRPSPTSRHFGFHALFNFNEVLDEEKFVERTKIALKSKYITNPEGVIWKSFAQKHQSLLASLPVPK